VKHLLGAMLAIALCTPLAATERLGLRSQVLQVRVRESLPMQVLGATAAWAVDPNIVQVGTLNGIVTLTGRAAGTTRIVILTAAGEQTLEVVVSAPRNATGPTAVDKQQNGQAEVRYSSADRSLQNTVTVRKETAGRTTEINVRNVNYGSGAPGEHAAVTVPSASYRIFTRNRELTLLDRVVDHSPLTLSGTTLRGAHYLDEHWRIHAGVTAYAAYQSFLLPTEREPVVGVGYKVGSFTPSAFVYPGQGALLSLLYDYAPMDGVIGRAEVAVGHGVGGAVQLAVDRGRDRARLDVRYRPESLPGVKATQMSGLVADGSWSRSTSRGSYVALGFSAADYDSIDIRTVTANADGAWRLNDRLSLLGGVSYGAFDATRSVTVPAGVQLDFRRGSLTALYRYARNSATNTGGNGFRVAARTSLGRVGINGYVDRQEQAPTLSLIFREQPQLALALEQLGISATSPADIARALRENAELIALGYIDGVTVDLAPTRTQAALELSFLGTSASRHQLRARILRNRVESVARAVDTTIATVSYARRLTPATDVFAAYTYWRTEARDQDAYVQPFIELGVRHRFNDLPSFGGGTIAGVVFIDEDLDGQSDGRGVADAEVELDGARRIKTAADGAFAFDNVRGGAHQVVARVRDAPAAYFTTPSRVDAVAGEPVTFGVAWTPARLQGRVTSDAGVGIAGVGVIVSRGAKQYRATTASDGSYAIIAPPGEWTMDIVPDSVPSGYSLTGIASRDVTLVREEPRQADLSLRANRSISGRATPHAEIVVEPLGKRVNADADGHFTVRSLPAGEVTLHMRGIIRPLLVPREPSALVVDFVEAAPQPAVRTIVSGERTDTMHWVVQIGAYRLRSNALEALHRARRTGVAATMTETPTLAIVRAGPYPTRAHADEAAEALERSGMNVIVQKSNGVR
jgi:opacity protein-like surface antigen